MVKIIADSTCDLSKEILLKYDISILPLHIICHDEEYLDRVSITPEEIFEWSEKNKTTPKTASASPMEVLEGIRPFVKAGRDVVCISISDELSTIGNVMRMTADALPITDYSIFQTPRDGGWRTAVCTPPAWS